MRNKAKADSEYRERLLRYISQVVIETLPERVQDDDLEDLDSQEPFGSRAFRPFPDPLSDRFEDEKQLDLYDIILSRNMHSQSHAPTCFKYGSSKCRSKFPRALVEETTMDTDTGLIRLQRDDPWLNGYNPWIALMLRANHDCKFLFSQVYALAIIHYVMKYISKPEQSMHAKLTVAAAVRRELSDSNSPRSMTNPQQSPGRQMLAKVYNRLDNHREVGIPEAVSHLCGFPDHYTSATFVNINTKTLLYYMKRRVVPSTEDYNSTNTDQGNRDTAVFDCEILSSSQGFQLMSPFDDYIYRGEHLSQLCLYDYFSLFYKERSRKGIKFDQSHPQVDTHCQILRRSSLQVPNLLGRLLFLRPDSGIEQIREDYHCLLFALFVPWNHLQSINPLGLSWEEYYLDRVAILSPRIIRIIENLDLLHKSKDEVQFDRIQRASLDGEDDQESPDYEDLNGLLNDDGIDGDDMDSLTATPTGLISLEQAEAITFTVDQGIYVQEALDAGLDYRYFDDVSASESSDTVMYNNSSVFLTHISPHCISSMLKDPMHPPTHTGPVEEYPETTTTVTPHVYISSGPRLEAEIQDTIKDFSLNEEQALAFAIVARQSCHGRQVEQVPDSEPQLLMGLFGEGGTGKSRVIGAIRKWFEVQGLSDELLITATTGVAATKIGGQTLHSAIGLRKDGKVSTVSKKVMDLWFNRRYLIIDEVSMMDAKLLTNLHNQLGKIKSDSDLDFGGVSILFAGDFLQLPCVSHNDVYILSNGTGKAPDAYIHWHKLNAVVILKQQMRQAEDKRYADLLSRIRHRSPTDEDLDLLYSRIGVPLPPSVTCPMTIVRRNNLRHAINIQCLKQMSVLNCQEVVYCIAKILKKSSDMSMEAIYSIRGCSSSSSSKAKAEDAVLALIPGAPLLITQNSDSSLGKASIYEQR